MQTVALLYQAKTPIDYDAVQARSEELLDSGIEKGGEGLFLHTKIPCEFEAATVPLQTTIIETEARGEPRHYAESIEQSWNCEDAEERISSCIQTVLVSEMMAYPLDAPTRLRLFHGVLQALIETSNPHTMVFLHSQQVIDPRLYMEDCGLDPLQRRGSLNVRFYRVGNGEEGDMLMDTRGLDDIGLHDLQCHYRGLPPNEVARLLFNIAVYLVENGPVIDSGNTVEGIQPGSKWLCQFEEAIVAPERTVLDINPGSPYAAGGRS
ncbi:MAG: DUF4261 domain-containing protein [Candidatus Melainabacteria bacterium]|nr:DUF4261 domain-containing protein [Candidatus Melainabacteria bacterium]